MEQDDRSGLSKAFNEKKRRIQELRRELNTADDEKERWFLAKSKLNQQISNLIKDIKTDKSTRDSCTSEVKSKKGERDNINNLIKQKIEEVRKLNAEKAETLKRYHIQSDPSQIKSQMDQLEHKLETEVMSFDKEKELMKAINDMKKSYDEVKKLSAVWERAHALSKEIEELKRQSDSAHRELQTKAKESQQKHETLIATSDEVKKLSKDEKDAFDKFIEAKKKFTAINQELKTELTAINELQGRIGELKEENVSKHRNEEHDKLEELGQTVQEKLKSGKKLTTEDLLVMQELESRN